MNYLISLFDCFAMDKQASCKILKNIVYEVDNCLEDVIIYPKNNAIPFCLNFKSVEKSDCFNVIKTEKDSYIFLYGRKVCELSVVIIKSKGQEFVVSLSCYLVISKNGEIVLNEEVDNLTYSHYEEIFGCLILFFKGRRKFVVVIKNSVVEFFAYYDEFNRGESELIFLHKFFDSLNHGKVCRICAERVETYLVYLDEHELRLKSSFVPHVFLDCVLAKNFKYCNELLDEKIKQGKPEDIGFFFPEFNLFYSINEITFVLINKNALAGIYKFEVNNNCITNILQVSQ